MNFLYYAILYPVSKLPFGVLYIIAHVLHFVLFYIVRYRRQTVYENLQRSFPNTPHAQIDLLIRKYFRYFSRMVMESLKVISISRKQLTERIRVANPEVLDSLFDEGRSVILAGSHYCNWEYLVAAQDMLFKHQAVGIGKKMSHKSIGKKINTRRQRFGMRVITASNYKTKMKEWRDICTATLVLFDQSPSNDQAAFWTNFLSQPTGFLFGTEKMAVAYDLPVVHFEMCEERKGHYVITLELISEIPGQEPYGKITTTLIQRLEEQICRAPEYWLWSHKRWKRQVPENLDAYMHALREKHSQWAAGL